MRSNSLYAIRVIPLSTKRERDLSKLLNKKYVESTKYYVGGGGGTHRGIPNIFYSPRLSYVKTWKTIKGVTNFLNTKVLNTITTHFTQSFENINEDWKSPTFEIVLINDEWNDHIDKMLDIEYKRHSEAVERIKTLKI